MQELLLAILPWIAIVVLNAGYWTQIYKIYKHREVRDLSYVSFLLFDISYIILAYESYMIESYVFLIKNILTTISSSVIIFLIFIHKDDEWHDDADTICECSNEIENHWKFCADCGAEINKELSI